MKFLFTIFICFVACSTLASGDLGVHIVGSNSVQSADRARALLNLDTQPDDEGFLETIETQTLSGVGAKNRDGTYNSNAGVAYMDKYLGESSVVGISIGGVYTEHTGDTLQSQDLTLSSNLYAATKASSLPLGAFVDLGYANFIGDATAFSNTAISALGGLALNLESSTKGLTYTPVLMLNSLYMQDSENADTPTFNALKMIAGIELDYAINENYTASLKGLYAYEFKDTTGAYSYNSFTGSYTSLGEVGKNSLQFGATLNYNFNDKISAGFDYSIYFYDTFRSNNISLKLDLSF